MAKTHIVINEVVLKNIRSIKTERKKRKLNQCALAEIIGINSSAVSLYEKGKIYPSLSVYLKFAEFFGWNMQDDINYKFQYKRKNMKRLKKKYYLSLNEISEHTGLSFDSVSKALYYRKRVSVQIYDKIMRLFNEEEKVMNLRKYVR